MTIVRCASSAAVYGRPSRNCLASAIASLWA